MDSIFQDSITIDNPTEIQNFFGREKSIFVVHINIRSLRTNFDTLLAYLQSSNHQIHVIICTEIGIDDQSHTCLKKETTSLLHVLNFQS